MYGKKHNPKRNLLLILTFFILNSAFYICTATVRYVSHSGSNTPPYTSWATAADSIMSAINISLFGDTIYVANGVYKEQVIMIPGLALIGAGMDSCVIDTRSLANSGFNSVVVQDSCLFRDFQVIVANQDVGQGIKGEGQIGLIYMNKILDGAGGIYLFGSNITVQENICINNRVGIIVDYSSSLVHNNYISTNYSDDTGIEIADLNHIELPVIFSNYIETNRVGIDIVLGTLVSNISQNIIVIKNNFAGGISGGTSDTAKIFNNLIISEGSFPNSTGISNWAVPTMEKNNLIYGDIGVGISVGSDNSHLVQIINNSIIGADYGIENYGSGSVSAYYNNAWNTEVSYHNFIPDTTNLSVDPMIVNDDTTQGELDFHLQMFSPLINAGDPNILDKDSTRSDIGLYGGPFGESYTYLDLSPRPPVNLTAEVDSNIITISWNYNTEADFSHYSLFRDTTANFTADSTTFVLSLTDTFYMHIIPNEVEAFYYKLTATDNQGNESEPSEELAVLITSVKEYPTTVSNYQLYQNYPNPFNPSTKISYRLKERGYVKLYIYDVKGELIEVLANQFQNAGYYEVEFKGEGKVEMLTVKNPFASGFYVCHIIVQNEKGIPVFSDLKKMILLK